MNPTDIIFNSISQMTGGLIADLSTAIIAMVMFAFIAMGFDLVLGVLDSRVQARKKLTGCLTVPRVDQKLEMENNSDNRGRLF